MDEVDATVVHSLKKVAKGAVVVVLSTAFAYVLKFLHRVVLARALPVSDYGAFALGFAVYSILAVIIAFGVPAGLPRLVAEWRAKRKNPRILVSTSVLLVLFFGAIISLFVYFILPIISSFLNAPSDVLLPFVLSAVFISLIRVVGGAARGYEDATAKALFEDVLFGVFLLFFVSGSAVLFHDVVVASYLFLASLAVLAIFSLLYLKSKGYLDGFLFDSSSVHTIIVFSSALFLASISALILSWTDTLMIGYFLGTAEVGIYNAAFSFARMIPFFLQAAAFLFLPVATSLFVSNRVAELQRLYQLMTKWIAVFTFPLVMITVFFPGVVLKVFFGESYLPGASVLQVLSLGYFVHAVTGPNGWALIAAGRSKYVSLSTLFAAVLNVFLNLLLIPRYGITGAAIASAASYTLLNVLYLYGLVRYVHILPFTRSNLKPILASVLPAVLLDQFMPHVFSVFSVLFGLVLYESLYVFALLLLKAFEKEDLVLLRLVERRIGLNLGLIESFLR